MNEEIEHQEKKEQNSFDAVFGIKKILDKSKSIINRDGKEQEKKDEIPGNENSENQINSIQNISNLLRDQEFHPILIFGTRASGKTTLLTSLLNYFRNEIGSNGTLLLSGPLLPTDTPQGKEVEEEAKNFFNRVVHDFNRGEPAPQTRFPIPFFIPLILEPKNSGKKIKIALLESQGGFYQVDKNLRGYNPEIKPEIRDIYENFDKPLSIILIAPFSPVDDKNENNIDINEEFANIDSGLLSVITDYQRYRNEKFRQADKINFLLTKWDMYFTEKKVPLYPQFFEFNPELIKKIIQKKYQSAWAHFVNMSNIKTGNKGAMPYSVGIIEENRNTNAGMHQRKLNEFPRRLWEWIYFNATNGKSLYGYKAGKKSIFRKILDIFF